MHPRASRLSSDAIVRTRSTTRSAAGTRQAGRVPRGSTGGFWQRASAAAARERETVPARTRERLFAPRPQFPTSLRAASEWFFKQPMCPVLDGMVSSSSLHTDVPGYSDCRATVPVAMDSALPRQPGRSPYNRNHFAYSDNSMVQFADRAAHNHVMTLPQVLEALLFASPKPLTLAELRAVLKSTAEYSAEPLAAEFAHSGDGELRAALTGLAASYREQGRAFALSEGAAGGTSIASRDCAPWVRQLFPENRPARLSPAALETLAIIAYRQPVTRAEIESVRGVDAGGVVQTLLDRGLARIAGRAEVPGAAAAVRDDPAFPGALRRKGSQRTAGVRRTAQDAAGKGSSGGRALSAHRAGSVHRRRTSRRSGNFGLDDKSRLELELV